MQRKFWTILSLLMLVSSLLLAQTDTATSTDMTTTETQAVETTTTTTETMVDSTTTETQPVDTTTMATTTMSEEQATAACAACAGVGLLVPLIGLAISIGIAYWIYKDATRRGDKNAVLWAVLGFFLSLLGLVIYLVARPKTTSPPPPPPAV